MLDLTTTYLGLLLKNPLVPSSSPLMRHLDNLKRMEDAGAAAVVLHSLFEEQIMSESQKVDFILSYGTESFPEALSYFPDVRSYNLGPDGYLEHIRRAKDAVSIPVIASLNGFSPGGWIEYARQIQEAGADALELNMYYIAADPKQDSVSVETMYLDLVREIKRTVTLPLAVKLGPYFTSFAHFARQLAQAGADALVLFNRFYQPDLDLDMLEIVPSLNLSSSEELRLRLRWVGLLYGRLNCDLAVTGGVHTVEDVLKAMMAGANVAMLTSALLEQGIPHLSHVLAALREWMTEREYESITQMRGSMSQRAIEFPAAYERANYVQVLRAYEPMYMRL
ncbi:MAG TPA: dihydroorotate dehydrogenase-like protein [Anaerolineae bacterium]|nr:dihydroorotate dehydrogenase-like protein [Anaerolineae bacterium]